MNSNTLSFIFLLSLITCLLSSCKDTSITTIKTPKQQIVVAQIQHPQNIIWTMPTHWTEQPTTEFRIKSSTVTSESNPTQTADFSIIAFPGDAGGLLANVNRWRNQLNLGAVSQETLDKQITHQNINALHVDTITITNTSSPSQTTIRAAIFSFQEKTYFLKFNGPLDLIKQEESSFMSILEGITYESI